MTTNQPQPYRVEYSDETGANAVQTFTAWQDARDAFLALGADMADAGYDYGFPTPDAWDLIGWETETTASYGYVLPLDYRDDRGNATASVSYQRAVL